MNNSSATPIFSLSRTLVMAANTFTQLMRMKVFYFILVFILLALVINLVRLPHTMGPESSGAEELRTLKSPLLGAMKMFSIILSIVATALLIPRDMEDRTLYTILAKPVPRLDYLLGKLLGVLGLIFVGLVVMTLVLDLVLYLRTSGVLAERMDLAARLSWSEEAIALERTEVLRHGPTWSLQAGAFTIFLEAAIMASIALLVSTFSSSTLFTVVISALVYFIGNFVAEGRDFWLSRAAASDSLVTEYAAKGISVIFPDLRLYGVLDAAIAGQTIPLMIVGKLVLITFLYTGIYTVLSWFVFADKEI